MDAMIGSWDSDGVTISVSVCVPICSYLVCFCCSFPCLANRTRRT
uniref:Uncharacterized protein n=1 Tax=Arundo donax TaxID=35708 RepID=A0A0A8ZB10_ARUDO